MKRVPVLAWVSLLLAVTAGGILNDDLAIRKDAKANDEAATECAVKTGYRFNCSDGTQSATCY